MEGGGEPLYSAAPKKVWREKIVEPYPAPKSSEGQKSVYLKAKWISPTTRQAIAQAVKYVRLTIRFPLLLHASKRFYSSGRGVSPLKA